MTPGRRRGSVALPLSVFAGATGSALAAGTLPDLLKLIPGGTAVLAVAFCIGLTLLGFTWWKSQQRRGVGISVFLKPDPSSGWSDHGVRVRLAQARNEHQALFHVNVDELQPGITGIDRFRLARNTISARLREEEGTQDASRLDFYITSSLPDAFTLGREICRTGLSDPAAPPDSLGFPSVHVHQLSHSAPTDSLPPIRIFDPNSGIPLSNSSQPGEIEVQSHFFQHSGSPPHRRALIIALTPRPDVDQMARNAISVPGLATDYAVQPDDFCVESHTIRLRSGALLPTDEVALNRLFEYIANESARFLATGPFPDSRVLIASPVSFAFALGAMLPSNVRHIPHLQR